MNLTDRKYLLLVGVHILIGFAHFLIAPFSKVYAIGILALAFFVVMRSRNRQQQVLYVCAYIVGAEVLLRMTGANILYEYGKYAVVVLMVVASVYSGFSKNAIPYWVFILLLVPGLLIATQTLGQSVEMRKAISFNISGPFCLGICSLYCFRRGVTLQQLLDILCCIGLPIISITTYLVFATPDLSESITSTGSNFVTSGGFGPNQVATILGLGTFIFFTRVVFSSPNKLLIVVNLFIALNVAFRGLITFSRGGMITGIVILAVLMAFTYLRLNRQGKTKISVIFAGAVLLFFGVWAYSSFVTGGLIDKRYANQDINGKVKEDRFSGREQIAETEIAAFLEHPVFGIGVARGSELRMLDGEKAASHNEITRMLAEHGIFGIFGLLILFFTPIILYFDNRNHLFLFSFLLFWLLTINHAAMRVAAPAFIYALSLLQIIPSKDEKPAVHRE